MDSSSLLESLDSISSISTIFFFYDSTFPLLDSLTDFLISTFSSSFLIFLVYSTFTSYLFYFFSKTTSFFLVFSIKGTSISLEHFFSSLLEPFLSVVFLDTSLDKLSLLSFLLLSFFLSFTIFFYSTSDSLSILEESKQAYNSELILSLAIYKIILI